MKNMPAGEYAKISEENSPPRSQAVGASRAAENETFTLRVVVCDFCMEPPNAFSVLKYGRRHARPGQPPPSPLTVMRVFGIAPNGTKCCAYVHGFLPYVLFRVKSRLDDALRGYFAHVVGEIVAQAPFARSLLVNGTDAIYYIADESFASIYGFCEKEYFIRVYFYDPRIAKICTFALQRECHYTPFLQPFEAHVPVTLQFFIDFALHGMDLMHLRRRYRRSKPFPTPCAAVDARGALDSPLRAASNMALDFDVFTDDILNPELAAKSHHQLSGLDFIWEEERRRCQLLGMDLQVSTPGNIGQPIVWMEREETQKAELRTALLTIRNAQRIAEGVGTLQVSQFAASQSSRRMTFSQPVIDELKDVTEDVSRSGPLNSQQQKRWMWNDVEDEEERENLEENRIENEEKQNPQMNNSQTEYANATITITDENDEADNSAKEDRQLDDRVESAQCDGVEVVTLESDSSEDQLDESHTIKKCRDRVGSHAIDAQCQSSTFSRDFREEIFKNAWTPRTSVPIRLDDASTTDDEIAEITSPSTSHVFDATAAAIGVSLDTSEWNRIDVCDNRVTLGWQKNNTPSLYAMASTQRPPTPSRSQQARERLLKSVRSSVDHLSVLSLEILVLSSESNTRPVADPKRDSILAVFYAFDGDVCGRAERNEESAAASTALQQRGVIMLDELRDARTLERAHFSDPHRHLAPIYVRHEVELFAAVVSLVQRYDPDILIGYNTTRWSWGFLSERAETLGFPFSRSISRMQAPLGAGSMRRGDVTSPPHGRIHLEVWRIVRRERDDLRCYRFANVARVVLGYTLAELRSHAIHYALHDARRRRVRGIVDTIMLHFLDKCEMNIDILDALDLFVRTSQMAQVYGIQFVEVLTRGSQFRVESLLLRLARRRRYAAPSISTIQRNLMGSPETIPLNLEPESGVYYDPVVVLDFQSLYPSVCIAHNYCYSTCLGKLSHIKAFAERCGVSDSTDIAITLGALRDAYDPCEASRILEWLDADLLTVSPTGGVFVRAQVRRSLLAEMLSELLDTRVMVKKAMRAYNDCRSLKRLLDARQLALKLVANVTYGYTAANWSGRMPCEELADAIVGRGRETLERTIRTVQENSGASTARYKNARVIYGDTDSIFVLFEGRSRADAFRLGELIAADVSAQNPHPMRLKFEKVLQPCALVTKKRYVGMSYETIAQETPKFDAKGIETVRRDSCEFVSKTVEQTLRLIFGGPYSAVWIPPNAKDGENSGATFVCERVNAALRFLKYRLKRVRDILPGEFVMSAEFRAAYSERAVLPTKKIADDLMARAGERAVPLRGERVSYVIASSVPTSGAEAQRALVAAQRAANAIGAAGGAVTTRAVAVDDFLADSCLELDFDYYVTRQLFPALHRFFQFFRVQLNWRAGAALRTFCLGCFRPRSYPFCRACLLSTGQLLARRVVQIRQLVAARRVCRACIGAPKSLANIEDALGTTRCTNVACASRQVLALAERAIRPLEMRRHIQALRFRDLHNDI